MLRIDRLGLVRFEILVEPKRLYFNRFYSDKSTAELTVAAFKCAAAVYKADPKVADGIDSHPVLTSPTGMHRNPETDGIKFSELEYVYPSLGGSSKAIGFWTTQFEVIDSTDPHFPALVVAVRGTERFVDHVVNANSRPIAAADLLVGLSVSTFPITSHLLIQRVSANTKFSTPSRMKCQRTPGF